MIEGGEHKFYYLYYLYMETFIYTNTHNFFKDKVFCIGLQCIMFVNI